MTSESLSSAAAPPPPPTLSIIIPCYNGSATIAETVVSALGQQDVDTEVIVVVDGSKDDLRAVLDHAGLLARLRFFRKENEGVAAARNFGLSFARGEYVCFLDHDDLLDPRFGSVMIGMLRSREFRIGYCDNTYFANVEGYPEVGIRYPTYEGRVLGKIISENFIPT